MSEFATRSPCTLLPYRPKAVLVLKLVAEGKVELLGQYSVCFRKYLVGGRAIIYCLWLSLLNHNMMSVCRFSLCLCVCVCVCVCVSAVFSKYLQVACADLWSMWRLDKPAATYVDGVLQRLSLQQQLQSSWCSTSERLLPHRPPCLSQPHRQERHLHGGTVWAASVTSHCRAPPANLVKLPLGSGSRLIGLLTVQKMGVIGSRLILQSLSPC